MTLLHILVEFPTHTSCSSKGTVADTVSLKFSYKYTVSIEILSLMENMHFGQIGNMVPECWLRPQCFPHFHEV